MVLSVSRRKKQQPRILDKHWAKADEWLADVDKFDAEKDAGLNREFKDCCGEAGHILNKVNGKEAVSTCGIGKGVKHSCTACGKHTDTMFLTKHGWRCAGHKRGPHVT